MDKKKPSNFVIPKKRKVDPPPEEASEDASPPGSPDIPDKYRMYDASTEEKQQLLAETQKRSSGKISISEENWKSMKVTNVQMIQNRKLKHAFDSYKRKHNIEQELIEYRVVYDMDEINKIAEKGLCVGSDGIIDIGDPQKGVMLYSSPALAYAGRYMFKNVPIIVMAFRTATNGKRNEVPLSSGKVAPSKKHSSHVLMKTEANSAKFHRFLLEHCLAGVYHYEYAPNMIDVEKYPKMILPHAVIRFDLSMENLPPPSQSPSKINRSLLIFQHKDISTHTLEFSVAGKESENRMITASVCSPPVSEVVEFFMYESKATPQAHSINNVCLFPELEILRTSEFFGKVLSSYTVTLPDANLVSHCLLRFPITCKKMIDLLSRRKYMLVWTRSPFTVFYLPPGDISAEFGFPHIENSMHLVVHRMKAHDPEAAANAKRILHSETIGELSKVWNSYEKYENEVPASANDMKFEDDDEDEDSHEEILPVTIVFNTPVDPLSIPKGVLRTVGHKPRDLKVRFADPLTAIKEFENDINTSHIETAGLSFNEKRKNEEKDKNQEQLTAEKEDRMIHGTDELFKNALSRSTNGAGDKRNQKSLYGSNGLSLLNVSTPSPDQSQAESSLTESYRFPPRNVIPISAQSVPPPLSVPCPPTFALPPPSVRSPRTSGNTSGQHSPLPSSFSLPPPSVLPQPGPHPPGHQLQPRGVCSPNIHFPPAGVPQPNETLLLNQRMIPTGVPPPSFQLPPAGVPPPYFNPSSTGVPTLVHIAHPPPMLIHQPPLSPHVPPSSSYSVPSSHLQPNLGSMPPIGQLPTHTIFSIPPPAPPNPSLTPAVDSQLSPIQNEPGEEPMDVDEDDGDSQTKNEDPDDDDAMNISNNEQKEEENDILAEVFKQAKPSISSEVAATLRAMPNLTKLLDLRKITSPSSESSSRDTDLRVTSQVNLTFAKPKAPIAKQVSNVLSVDDDDDDDEVQILPDKHRSSSNDMDYRKPQPINSRHESQNSSAKDRDDRLKDIDDRFRDIPVPNGSPGGENLKKRDQNMQEKLRAISKGADSKVQTTNEHIAYRTQCAQLGQTSSQLQTESPVESSLHQMFPILTQARFTANGLVRNPIPTTSTTNHQPSVQQQEQPPPRSPSPDSSEQTVEYIPGSFLDKSKQNTCKKDGYNKLYGDHPCSSSDRKEFPKSSPKKSIDLDNVERNTSDKQLNEKWKSLTDEKKVDVITLYDSEEGEVHSEDSSTNNSSPTKLVPSKKVLVAGDAPPGITSRQNLPGGRLPSTSSFQIQSPRPSFYQPGSYNPPYQQGPFSNNRRGRGGHNQFMGIQNGNSFAHSTDWISKLEHFSDKDAYKYCIFVDPDLDSQAMKASDLENLFTELLNQKRRQKPYSPRVHSMVYIHNSTSKMIEANNKKMSSYYHIFRRFREGPSPLVQILHDHLCDTSSFQRTSDLAACMSRINNELQGTSAIFLTQNYDEESPSGQSMTSQNIKVMSIRQLAQFIDEIIRT